MAYGSVVGEAEHCTTEWAKTVGGKWGVTVAHALWDARVEGERAPVLLEWIAVQRENDSVRESVSNGYLSRVDRSP